MARSIDAHPPGCGCIVHRQPVPAEPTKVLSARVPLSVARAIEQAGGARAILMQFARRHITP